MIVVERLRAEALHQPQLRVEGGGQLDAGVAELAIGGAEEVAGPVVAAPRRHQHRGADEFGAGHHQLLRDERSHRHCDDADGVEVELFDQRGGVGDHLLGAETARLLGRADPPVVEGDRAVAGPHELRDLM